MSNFVIAFDGLKINFDNSVDHYIAIFLGFGVFFSWISLFSVLNDIQNFDILNKTFSNATTGVIGVLIASCPIFLGFVFTGFSMFNDNPEMDSPSKIIMSLVSMIGGDETINTMRRTALIFGFKGYVFTYAFSFVFYIMINKVVVFLFTSTFMKELKDSKTKRKETKTKPISKYSKKNQEVKLHRGNMMTTRMLRTSDKTLARDRIKAKSKYMFEANMKKVKKEIEQSIKDKKSIDFLELKRLADSVNISIIEMDSTIGDLHDNSVYMGEEIQSELQECYKKYLDYIYDTFHYNKWPGVTIEDCLQENSENFVLPFNKDQFQALEKEELKRQHDLEGMVGVSDFSMSYIGSRLGTTFD
jgi:hypothetical protein